MAVIVHGLRIGVSSYIIEPKLIQTLIFSGASASKRQESCRVKAIVIILQEGGKALDSVTYRQKFQEFNKVSFKFNKKRDI